MSLEKKSRVVDVIHVDGLMEVEEYVYTPGIAGLKVAEALIEGKILGVKCGETVYLPAKTYCPDYSEGGLVEIKGPWIVKSYTIIYESMHGSRLEKPKVIALIAPEDAQGGLIHYIEADPSIVKVGLRVEPVFKPREERKGNLSDIAYFKPI